MLFTDLTGSTDLIRDLDPEEAQRLLWRRVSTAYCPRTETWELGACPAPARRHCGASRAPGTELAAGHYRQALALADELGMRPLQAHCHLGLGILYGRTGQRQQAHTELSTAIALYRDMDMTFWLPQAQVARAQVQA